MLEQQWLFFQGSGQGFASSSTRLRNADQCFDRPYFGQVGYFRIVNPSPSVPREIIERYQKEILRVLSVLEEVLSKRDWLVGGKCTVADISFVP